MQLLGFLISSKSKSDFVFVSVIDARKEDAYMLASHDVKRH